MKQDRVVWALGFLLATIAGASAATAQQTSPTAVQKLQLSAFGAASGVYTGFFGGKNIAVTAGVDLGLPPFRRVRPTLEVRGTTAFDKGTIDSQKDVLGGLRVDFLLGHRWQPYGDFLFGRGQMDYGPYGYPYNGQFYVLTTTYVYSPGGGLDYYFSDHFGIKLDAQLQRWGGPTPTPSGSIYSKVGTAGIVYRFGSRRGPR